MKNYFKLLFLILIFGISINIVKAEHASCQGQVDGNTNKFAVGESFNYSLGTMGSSPSVSGIEYLIWFDANVLEIAKNSSGELDIKVIDGWKVTYEQQTDGWYNIKASTTDTTKVLSGYSLKSFAKIVTIKFNVKSEGNKETSIAIKGPSSSFTGGLEGDSTQLPCGNGDINASINLYSKDTNASLASLKVNKGELTPAFDSNVTDYTVDVENEDATIEIEAKCAGTKCQSTGAGTKELKVGENKFVIKVTSESGKVNEYKITVNRAAKEEIFLNKLEIKNGKLGSEFDSKKYNYTINVDSNVEKLDIKYEVNDKENVDVKVVGNENFKEGNNIVTIELTNIKTEETIKYELYVNKAKEEVKEEKKSSLGLIIALVVVSLIAVGAVVYIVISKKKAKKNEVISSNEVVETNEEKEENKDE